MFRFQISFHHYISKQTRYRKAVLEIFGDTAEPRGTILSPLGKIFVLDVTRGDTSAW
jgi:hypothetical protein